MLYKGNRSAATVSWCLLLGLVAALLMPAGLVRAAGSGQPRGARGAETVRARDDEPEQDEPQEREGRRRRPPSEFIERFRNEEDIRELIEVVRVWRMSRELDLSEDQALKLLMITDKHRKAIGEMWEQRRRVIDELHDALDEGKGDSELETLIGRVDEIDVRMAHAEGEHHKQLLDGLSPEQKARFYVFRPRFERDVRETIRRIMERRRRADEEEERETGGDNDDRPNERNADRERGRDGSRRE